MASVPHECGKLIGERVESEDVSKPDEFVDSERGEVAFRARELRRREVGEQGYCRKGALPFPKDPEASLLATLEHVVSHI